MRDGLTKREIGWLLAQEARGAAQALRRGIELKIRESLPPPSAGGGELEIPALRAPTLGGLADLLPSLPSPVIQVGPAPAVAATPLLDSLSALDDAIGLLGDLQSRGGSKRRGRIDVAALLYDLAPQAKITLSSVVGTEVAGEEDELVRMLQLLLADAGQGRSLDSVELEVGRDGDFVRVTAELGPDAAATDGLERRWLNRMAMRFGGRLETSGRSQTLVLPADGTVREEELSQLRSELAQAQELGEAYARELAEVLSSAEERRPGLGETNEAWAAQRRFGEAIARSGGGRNLAGSLGPVLEQLLTLPEDEPLSDEPFGEWLASLREVAPDVEWTASGESARLARQQTRALLGWTALAFGDAGGTPKVALAREGGSFVADYSTAGASLGDGPVAELVRGLAAHLGARLEATPSSFRVRLPA